MTWVGYTNTFLVAIANLLTATATLIYVLRTKRESRVTKEQVGELKSLVEDSSVIIPIKPAAEGKHGFRE